MSRRRVNAKNRCERCRLSERLCLCDLIQSEETKTKLWLLVHQREATLTSSTANLASLLLSQAKLFYYGGINQEWSLEKFNPEEAAYLFPDEDSMPLSELTKKQKITHLLIPDGNWRQAKKLKYRRKELEKIPSVHVTFAEPKIYTLRGREEDHQRCTLEAISEALGILEGEAIKETLLTGLQLFNDRVWQGRLGR